jgi:hypothetical protein
VSVFLHTLNSKGSYTRYRTPPSFLFRICLIFVENRISGLTLHLCLHKCRFEYIWTFLNWPQSKKRKHGSGILGFSKATDQGSGRDGKKCLSFGNVYARAVQVEVDLL